MHGKHETRTIFENTCMFFKSYVLLFFRNTSLTDTDIEYLQSLEDTPIGYLASLPFQTTMTEHGPQNIGSTLAHQVCYTLSFISKGINPVRKQQQNHIWFIDGNRLSSILLSTILNFFAREMALST